MLRFFILGILIAVSAARPRDDDPDLFEGDMLLRRTLNRVRRQAGFNAMNLAGKHDFLNGNPRPVGEIHTKYDLAGVGKYFKHRKDNQDFHANAGAGIGSVLYRSHNKKHSVGAGLYGEIGAGRSHGQDYRSKPDFGVGLGYQYKFG